MSTTHLIETPFDRLQLSLRWQAMCAAPTADDMPGKVELNEWGEILLGPLGKTRSLMITRVGSWLHDCLGGHVTLGVGILTSAGIRAPQVARCSDAWLAAHPEESPLTSAPELCIESSHPATHRPSCGKRLGPASKPVRARRGSSFPPSAASKCIPLPAGRNPHRFGSVSPTCSCLSAESPSRDIHRHVP